MSFKLPHRQTTTFQDTFTTGEKVYSNTKNYINVPISTLFCNLSQVGGLFEMVDNSQIVLYSCNIILISNKKEVINIYSLDKFQNQYDNQKTHTVHSFI